MNQVTQGIVSHQNTRVNSTGPAIIRALSITALFFLAIWIYISIYP